MSFSIKLVNGDIAIGSNQDFDIVVNNEKLIQDVMTFVSTPLGENKFQPSIGSLVNKRLIGQILTPTTTVSILQASVQEALINLQKLQKQQAQYQTLSPGEMLIAIKDIAVSRDPSEPRQLNVVLKILTGDGGLITDGFSLRVV